MKIAFLLDEYESPHAGTEHQLLLLIAGLKEQGHDVSCAVLRPTPYTESGNFPVEVEVLNARKIANPLSIWRIYRWARRLRAAGTEVVQIFFNDASVLGPWPLKAARLRVIVSRRDVGFWRSGALRILLRAAAPAVDVVVANSRVCGELACDAEWLPRRKLEVIANGLPAVTRTRSDSPPVPPCRREARVGIVANIRPIKRLDTLLQAIERLRSEGRDVELVIVGGGDEVPLRRLARELQIAEAVIFAGRVPNPEAWIATFDVGVLCSESEGLSNALMEYARDGVPSVATDTGGNGEVVEDGRTGLLVPVGDARALAGAIDSLLSDRQRAARMGAAAKAKMQSQYSVKQMIDRHIALYQTVRAAGGH